jgi:lipid-A-disaccharide synthase
MNYFLIAGEASGDTHAAQLITHLQQLDGDSQFAGLGGEKMQKAGCCLYQDYSQMAFMGVAAVLRNIGKVRRNFQIARKALLRERPDVLVLVDYPSFNLRIAAFCRKHLPNTKIVYYIPPKVWAWKRRRVHRIARLCDAVLGIFPFEPSFYAQHGYKCTYVGNPTAEQIAAYKAQYAEITDRDTRPTIAILPGSRASEVSHCLPTMLSAARQFADYQLTICAAPGLDDEYYKSYLLETETLTRDTYAAVRNAQAAIVNSGTATLETALLGCPQVAVYHLACSKLIGLLRWAQPLVFSIPYFTLVNILAQTEVIRELVANDFKAEKIVNELQRILTDETYKKNMLASYEHIHSLLGEHSAAETAARIITSIHK